MCLFYGNSHLFLIIIYTAKMPVDLAFSSYPAVGISSKLKGKNEREIFLYQHCMTLENARIKKTFGGILQGIWVKIKC